MCASLCANEAEYDGNYVDGFDNEISQERQEGEFGLFVLCLCVCPSVSTDGWPRIKACFSVLCVPAWAQSSAVASLWPPLSAKPS